MKFEVGSIYCIDFRDHCIGQRMSIKCTVVGWILSESEHDIVLTFWDSEMDEKWDKHEPFVIVKSTIVKKRKLR